MSTFTLQGSPLTAATVRVPRYGVWTATATVAGPLDLAAGSRVSLVVGDLTLTGTVVAGGTYAQQASYSIVGGAGRWLAPVAAKAHRSDGGITVAQVAADLATDAGEIGAVLEAGVERPLGYAWERRAGIASDALEQLVGSAWWVAADGVTHLGARPARPIRPPTLHVLGYEPAIRRARCSLDDDAVAQLLPGAQVTADGLPDVLDVGATVIRVEADAVEVELQGERPASELLAAFFASLAARARAASPQLYQVTEVASGRASGHPAGQAAKGLPDLPWIDCAYGIPGASAVLVPGARVMVALLDGVPGAPQVVGYLPGQLPTSVTLDADVEVKIGGAAAVTLAKGAMTDANFTVVAGALAALGHPISLSSVQTTKAKGA